MQRQRGYSTPSEGVKRDGKGKTALQSIQRQRGYSTPSEGVMEMREIPTLLGFFPSQVLYGLFLPRLLFSHSWRVPVLCHESAHSPHHLLNAGVPNMPLGVHLCQGVCVSLSFLCEVFPQGAEHRCLDDASGAHEAQDFVFVQEVDCDVFRGFEMLAVKTAYTCGDKAVA